MKYKKILMLFMLIIVTGAAVPRCTGRGIYLSDDGYNPCESIKNMQEYKDAEIYLGSFRNNASKTKRYKYFSADNSVSYSTSYLLPDYIWYCFKKAFTEIGMKVNESNEAPVLYLMINDMNDRELKFDINLYKGDDLVHAKEVIVTMPTAYPAGGDLAMLEKNAYNMMDAAAAAILNDDEFKTILIKPSSVAAIEKKTEGTLVGIVKAVSVTGNEIIVSSGRIAFMVNIGDIIFIMTRDGIKISMEVSFPMQTIARCKVIEKDRKNIIKVKSGDRVYK